MAKCALAGAALRRLRLDAHALHQRGDVARDRKCVVSVNHGVALSKLALCPFRGRLRALEPTFQKIVFQGELADVGVQLGEA